MELDKTKTYFLINLSKVEAGLIFDEVAKTNKVWTNREYFIEKQYKNCCIYYNKYVWTWYYGKPEIDARILFDRPIQHEGMLSLTFSKGTGIEAYTVSQEVIPTETFYYLKSSHGDNFYKVLDTIQVKNEFHDWKEYVSYMQLGTQRVFHKPTEMFYSEFKRVEV